MRVVTFFFIITLALQKEGEQRNPSNPVATQAPRMPWDVRWEKGRASRVGVLTQLEDG